MGDSRHARFDRKGLAGLGLPGDRFRVSLGTDDPKLVAQRRAMLDDLCTRFPRPDAILSGLARRVLDIATVHAAYRAGADALARLALDTSTEKVYPAVEAYLAARTGELRTLAGARAILVRFCEFVGVSVPLVDAFTTDRVSAYLGQLRARSRMRPNEDGPDPVSPNTRNNHRTVLQAFGSWCVATRRLDTNPVVAVPLAKLPPARIVVWTADTQRRYLAALRRLSPDAYMIGRVLIATGVDMGELYGVAGSDVPPIEVRDVVPGTPARLRAVRTKTYRARFIPLPASLAAELATWTTVHGLTPADRLALPCSRAAFELAHRRACRAIGDRITIKGLRHVAAINWRRAGVDLMRVRDWLGHADLSQTAVYAEFGPDDEAESASVEVADVGALAPAAPLAAVR